MTSIKTFFNVLKNDIYRAIFSAGFPIGIIATLAIFFFGSVGMINNTTPAVTAFVHTYGYNNIINLLFLTATFAYSTSFSVEWQSVFFRSVVIRSKPVIYALSKCIATAISSGLTVSIGAVLFIVYTCITQPAIIPDAITIDVEFSTFKDLLTDGHPLLFFLSYIYIIFLQAMFFGVLGLLTSGYFPNKYVAYVSPFTLGFAMTQIANTLDLPIWLNPVKLALGRVYNTSTYEVLLVETVVFLLLTAVCSNLFVYIVKKRIANE